MRETMPRRHYMKSYQKIALALLFLVILAAAFFQLYVTTQTYPAENEALQKIKADPTLTIIEERNCFILKPEHRDPGKKALIYYPGGLVAPEAYLHKMGKTAVELEKTVFIIKAPFNAAIFDSSAAGRIIRQYELEQAWVGGHSLGGISASRFAASSPESVYGLFLFGSYSDRDLAGFAGPVISVMGLQDKIINQDNYLEAKANLPSNALIFEIEGLNHSDFGNYGLQQGDGPSSLTDEEVIALIVSLFDGS